MPVEDSTAFWRRRDYNPHQISRSLGNSPLKDLPIQIMLHHGPGGDDAIGDPYHLLHRWLQSSPITAQSDKLTEGSIRQRAPMVKGSFDISPFALM